MSLTDDQRARCATLCGWTATLQGMSDVVYRRAGLPEHYRPPPIETMPEEWTKLMERAMRKGWEVYYSEAKEKFTARWWNDFEAKNAIRADTIGECVCLAALAMDKETRDE